MERWTRRRTAARASPWLLLLCLAAAAAVGVLQASSQPDSKGFISIDCGLPLKASYVDKATELSYVPDAGFTDGGASHNISAEYIRPLVSQRYHNVRSFPDGARNCYTLRSLLPGLKYLLRATFMYGDYDGLIRPPVFDLHVGVNFWQTINVSSPGLEVAAEAIVVVPNDFVQVCLVNTGAGTPFISALELRPLSKKLYPRANATQGLVLSARLNLGPTDETKIIRYPDDPHDRIWLPFVNATEWTEISTTQLVHSDNDDFDMPSAVLQTAATPRNASGNIEFYWDPEPLPGDPSQRFFVNMQFSELQLLPLDALRRFDVNVNGVPRTQITPYYLGTGAVTFVANPYQHSRYNFSINATANSTLPPLMNAIELFSVISTANLGTDSQDVSAITAIKAKCQVRMNWMGDPCAPKTMAWDRLNCSYTISRPPRITRVNMSFSGLSGDMLSSFATLKAVQYLDLSNNNLTGSIPDRLSQLPSLTVLDLSGNQLNGTIPYGLLKRIQDGTLDFRYANNPNLCTNAYSCQPSAKRKSKLAIYIAVPIVVTVVLVSVAAVFFCLQRRKLKGSMNNSVQPQNETAIDGLLESRSFTYEELKRVTNNFERVLGRGGFGYVYHGFLEDRTEVAVKLRSQSSNQGPREFLTEVHILTRIHHKNLVSMVGYCKDGEQMALVYEFISEGTLQQHITATAGCLSWRQRLRIAVESAQGLEYLHKGCNPPLIHRDVKATNILLNARLEAKIADFGLSKAFDCDGGAHVSTNMAVVGTPGYVDPEYQATMQPTTKSDVYSFGVVLLQLVTGKPAMVREPPAEPIRVIDWAGQRLAVGNIESVMDARMTHGHHDINAVWKAADIALKCTAQASLQRPTMTDVVKQLQECLELEQGRAIDNENRSFRSNGSNGDPNLSCNSHVTDQTIDVSQSSAAFEMAHNFGRVLTMDVGPAVR